MGVLKHRPPGGDRANADRVPAAPLLVALRNPRVLTFVGVWFGLNLLFGLGTVSFLTGENQSVAWEAHVGGFLAGLLLFSGFDPVQPAPIVSNFVPVFRSVRCAPSGAPSGATAVTAARANTQRWESDIRPRVRRFTVASRRRTVLPECTKPRAASLARPGVRWFALAARRARWR